MAKEQANGQNIISVTLISRCCFATNGALRSITKVMHFTQASELLLLPGLVYRLTSSPACYAVRYSLRETDVSSQILAECKVSARKNWFVATFAASLGERRRDCGARRLCVCASMCVSVCLSAEPRLRARCISLSAAKVSIQCSLVINAASVWS